MSKKICIYHKNCTDGTTAAAVLLKKFKDCELLPLEHGYAEEDFEGILSLIGEDTEVYIVDFSPRIEDLEKIINDQICACGASDDNVKSSGVCTFDNEEFFSARRHGGDSFSAMMTVAGIKK